MRVFAIVYRCITQRCHPRKCLCSGLLLRCQFLSEKYDMYESRASSNMWLWPRICRYQEKWEKDATLWSGYFMSKNAWYRWMRTRNYQLFRLIAVLILHFAINSSNLYRFINEHHVLENLSKLNIGITLCRRT